MEKRTLEVVPVCLVMLVGTGCVDPKDRRPGLWLSGDAVTAPVTDWSFSDAFRPQPPAATHPGLPGARRGRRVVGCAGDPGASSTRLAATRLRRP